MPVSDHEELGVNLLAQQSGDSIAGVPIKKRRFILSQFLSPTQTPSLPPDDSERPLKKLYISEAESSASDSSAQPALGTDFITDGSLEAKGDSLDNRDVNTACGHENHTESSVQELRLKTATSAIKGTGVVKDSNMDDKSALSSGMQNNQLLSPLKRPSDLPLGEKSGEEKFASGDKSAFQRVASMSGWQLAPSRDGKDTGDSSVKQDKVDHLSSDLPLGVRHTIIHNNYSNLSSRVDPFHHCVNRSNWDLNVPMDTWDSSASVSVSVQNGHDSSTYGGIHKQKFETHPVRMTPGESSKMVQKSNNLRLGNFSMSSDDPNTDLVGLDLQLKPPSRPELCINWGAMAPPDLSLSLAGSTIDISSKAVKPEPYEEVSQNSTSNVEMVSLKSVGFRQVKPEPCDGSSQGKDAELAGSRDNKSACAGMVKSEPAEEPSQDSLKRLTGKSPDVESDNHRLMPYYIEGRPDASETKAMDLNSEAVSVDDELHDHSRMPASADLPASESGGASVGLVSQAVIPDSNRNDHGELHNSTCLFQDEEGNDTKTSDLASKSQISEGKGLNSVSETCEVVGQVSNSLTEPLVFGGDKEPAVFDGMSEGSAEMDCSDDYDNIASANLVAMDEHRVDSCGNGKVGENAQERINFSADIQRKQSNYDEHGSIGFHNANDARERTLEKGDGDDECEDGRVRDSMLMSHDANVSLSKKGSKDVLGKETTDTIGPTDMPTVMPSNMDTKEKETDPDEMKTGYSIEKIISVLCNNNNDINLSSTKDVHELSVMEVPKASSSKTKLIKTVHKITENHPQKEKGSEMTSKSTGSPSAKKIAKSSEGDKGPGEEDTRGFVPSAKHLISSKKNSPLNAVAIKHIDDWDRNSQIKKLNSAPNRSSFGKSKSPYARSISSQTERERLTDKSHWRERPHSRWTRNDRCSDRTLKYESGKNEDLPFDKHGSDFFNNRKGDDRFGALYCNRNSGPPGDPELHDQKIFRFSRPPYSRGEAAFSVEPDGSMGNTSRIGRGLPENEPPRLSRFLPRRRSPVPREVPGPSDVQIAGPSVRDVSPSSRYIGRVVRDPLLLSREEKIMRALPDDMMDPLPFPHPRLLYERVDNDLIRRQRRSHSPIHRRIPARLQRAHSPHQWSPSRRSSDVLDGHPELIRCRSPPAFRMDRLRSPHQNPCFPEDEMFRRHGSPPPFPRLLDDIGDIHPLDEHDLPRPGRVLQRNIRRFDLIGPQESADEEYFRRFPVNQLHELEGDDEFVARKKFDERRGFLHSLAQRPIVSNDGENCLPYPIEDGPRPIRFCPEAEEMFPDRGCPRDFDGHIGNRIGNMPNRLRGMAERGDDYRYHGAPGWRDGGLNDARLKRRRL